MRALLRFLVLRPVCSFLTPRYRCRKQLCPFPHASPNYCREHTDEILGYPTRAPLWMRLTGGWRHETPPRKVPLPSPAPPSVDETRSE